MKRVMVVGAPGSGKSMLALALGEITGLPVFHMDHIQNQPGRAECGPEEKLQLAGEIEAKPRWIVQGGRSSTYGSRAARADTVIWLDLPLALRFARILKRQIQFSGSGHRPDLPQDCPERLSPDLLGTMFRTRNSARAAIANAIKQHPQVHHIRTLRGIRTYLDWTRNDHAHNH